MSLRRESLSLYRKVLRAASRFPSIKAPAMVEDIRVEWREHRDADDAETRKLLDAARDDLFRMMQYSGLKVEVRDGVLCTVGRGVVLAKACADGGVFRRRDAQGGSSEWTLDLSRNPENYVHKDQRGK